MTDQWSRRRWMQFVWGSIAVGMATTALAIVLKSLALMVLSVAFSMLAGLILFMAMMRGRGTEPSRPFPPPGTRL